MKTLEIAMHGMLCLVVAAYVGLSLWWAASEWFRSRGARTTTRLGKAAWMLLVWPRHSLAQFREAGE